MQKTKRKIAGRRVLSFLLSVALLASMLPASQGQVVKAATTLTAQGVTYEVKTDSAGSQYISLNGMASDYADCIDEEGTLTLPSEIDGVPVKEVSNFLNIDQGKKVIVPASINSFAQQGYINITDSVEELYIMCQGLIKSEAKWGAISFIEYNSMKDIYFYPTDFEGDATTIFPFIDYWNDFVEGVNVTVHVSSQTVLDKLNADEGAQREKAEGRLTIVKDIEVSAGTVIQGKQESLAAKISQGEAMAEEDYTGGSWSALQAALGTAKESAESTEEATLDAAISAMDTALAGMVSLEPIKKAINSASDKRGKTDTYRASTLQKLENAITVAQAVADDATTEDVAALANAITDAYRALKLKGTGTMKISWEDKDTGVIVPPMEIVWNYDTDSSSLIKLYYYQDAACTTPAVGQDASEKPAEPGEYYVRGYGPATGEYTEVYSNVLKFTLTERQVDWDGYEWDEETRTLTITEDMVDFPDTLELPWYEYRYLITTVIVKEGVTLTRVGAYAFDGAYNLTEFQIPSTVKSVGDNAFNGCRKLESTLALTDLTVGENAFNGCVKLPGLVSLSEDMTEIPAGCFAGCPLEGITIPEGVTAIGKEAFKGTKAFVGADLILPATVTAIGESSFYEAGIASVRLPENLESIGKSAFEGNSSIESITLPAALTELGSRAFASTGLKQAVIPATVQNVGGGLFAGCESLHYVEFAGTEYDEDSLLSETETVKVSGADRQYDTMFDGTSPDLAVLCDGTTYTTLAGYAGTVENDGTTRGWSATILHKTQEYMSETLTGYQTDKEALAALDRADYAEAAWNSLQTAIAQAEAMLVEDGSKYDIIASRQAARKKLAEGVAACLQDTIDKANAFLAGDHIEKDYDPESDSWYALQDALEDGGRLIEENTAGVGAIIAQIQAINTAKSGLVPRSADTEKAALDTAIAAAKALTESSYTPESWQVLQAALAEAEALKEAGTISQIEAAQKKVEEAVAALVQSGTGNQPGTEPSAEPSTQPGTEPSAKPSETPGVQPSRDPSVQPSQRPNASPSTKPTAKPQAPKVKKATVKKAKSTKKKTITVQWKKLSGVTGYQVQIAQNKKFKKGKKTYTIKKAKTTKKTIKKLKSKKKYYLRVRAYKTVSGKKYYGSWSKVKTVKVK